ncbi:MAG: hypothetical protein D6796_01490, partial [Caldilineae bacterium]
MQRRLLILIGVLLAFLAVGALAYVLLSQQGGGGPAPEAAVTVEPTQIPMVEVIIARQPIPRGGEFLPEALGRMSFPESSVPPNAIVNEAETIGKIARSDIAQGQIILYDLLRDKSAPTTNEAAFDIPPGHVMVAFPINKQTSVAYALQAGDVVDVLMTFSIVDLDPDFQTILPNKFSFLLQDIQGAGGEQQTTSVSLSPAIDKGRLNIENEQFPGFEFPQEPQRPRRVAQLTVQKAKVIKVGPWIEIAPPEAAPPAEGEPTPTPVLPDVASLAVTPQDALVLLWARQSKVYMELALRAAGDENADHSTEAVTLQYMLARFNIAVPPKLEFGIDKSEDAVTPAQPTP